MTHEKTKNVVEKQNLSKMKTGSFFIVVLLLLFSGISYNVIRVLYIKGGKKVISILDFYELEFLSFSNSNPTREREREREDVVKG